MCLWKIRKSEGLMTEDKNLREPTYGWFMLIYGRNQHNIIKQLSSSYK